MHETGCPPTTSKAKLRSESVNFSDIPGQSKLFLQYQSNPLSLRKYYSSAVASHTDVAARVDEVLEAHTVDRNELANILAEQNRRFSAGTKTFEHIELLRQKKTVAILTGQQTGLLTGPLYTIYKALSALKMAECLRNRGIDAVPVFWAATEDHDFEEISRAYILGAGGEEIAIELTAADEAGGRPVGGIDLPASFASEVKRLLAALPDNEFTDEFRERVEAIWTPGHSIGDAFCTHLQSLSRDYGLIVVDPLDARLKKLAAPVFAKAIGAVDEIVPAIVDRSKELESDGYHAQVLVTPDYFPLFYHSDDGVRRSVRKSGQAYRITGTNLELTKAELYEGAIGNPERFSPGVMLRPVVQDYLFPTICYFGGGAEIAYFAQNSEVYRLLERPVTPILHRQSFTIIESKHARTLEKYDLRFADIFGGLDELLPRIVEKFVNPSTAEVFPEAEGEIDTALDRLNQELSRIDPTLGDNLTKRRRKILYHIEALRKKFHRAQIARDEIVNRQLQSLFASLLPHGELQERRLNVGSFTSRYGGYFIDWVYDSIELDERGHCLLYL